MGMGRDGPVPHGVDAVVKPMQATDSEPVRDLAGAESELEHLAARDHAVLRTRERGDEPVGSIRRREAARDPAARDPTPHDPTLVMI
jgi:hypothetical protein